MINFIERFRNIYGTQIRSATICYITIFDFKNAVTLKTGLGVRQGHWKCHHVIERIDFIDVLQWLYLVLFLRYSMSKNVVTLKLGSEVTRGH